jgi:hypothetical protein
MRKNSLIVLLAVGLIAALSFAQDKPADKSPDKSAAPTPEQMMAAMVKYGTPGPEHEKLKPMEGTFDAEVTMQMAPDAPPMTSKGKIVNKLIMGGRYLHGDYTGDFAGQPFHGASLMGFDKLKKKYLSLWIDSMSTAVMMAEGDADSAGKTLTLSCTYDCPITESKKTSRQVVTIVDENTHTYDMYDVSADGKEFKAMGIKYSRAK